MRLHTVSPTPPSKTQGYDKRKVIAKQRNTNSKKVNKFRKLMKKMEESGELQPLKPWEKADGPREAQDPPANRGADAGGRPQKAREGDGGKPGPRASGKEPRGGGAQGEGRGGGGPPRGAAGGGAVWRKKKAGAVEMAARKAQASAEREKRERERAETAAERELAHKSRQKKKKLFFKKTAKGQPVLKSRMQDLLAKITGE